MELNNLHYLYRHIRLDINQPFYIGIGKKTEQDIKYFTYHRAYSKRNRNQWWKNIVSKTEFAVDIIMDDLSEKQCKEKEIEFIKLYGRKDLKKGNLCNLTDGGETNSNISSLTKEKFRKCKLGNKNPNYGKSLTEETKRKISESMKGTKSFLYGKKYRYWSKLVLNLETGIFYDSIKEAYQYSPYKYKAFKAMLNGQNPNKTSFIII